MFSCSREHLIIGRDQEERAVKKFIDDNISTDSSGLLYACGHPGQGKTAVINQVLFNYFGDMDANLGGISDDLYILKYNGMRYANSLQFAQSLSQDLNLLIDFELRRKTNLIKSLRKMPPRQRSTDAKKQLPAEEESNNQKEGQKSKTREMALADVIISQLQMLRRKRPHFLLLIDEIDAFARGSKDVNNSSMRKSMAPVHSFREFLKELISRGRQKESQKVAADTLSKSLSRKRLEATNAKVKGLNGIEGEKKTFSLSIVGIANSVELFKGEVGKGGSMQAVRQSQVT